MGLSFAPHVEAVAVEQRGLAVLGEHGCEVYSGVAYAQLASLVDGTRDEPDIVAGSDEVPPEAVAAAISTLTRAGVLIEDSNGASLGDAAAWWTSQRVAPGAAESRIHEASVRVQALGDLDAQPTLDALEAGGLRPGNGAALTIVLVDDYLEDGLSELNELALERNQTWMLGRPRGAQILVGPVFAPERGPCWECLATRLRGKRAVEMRLRNGASRKAADTGTPLKVTGPRSLEPIGPAIIATEALQWIAGTRSEYESTIRSFDTRSWQSASHHVPWRPQCPACGEAEGSLGRPATPIHVRQSSSGRTGSGLRAVDPKVTLERFERHVSPLTGAVSGLFRIPGPAALHVYAASDRQVRIIGDRNGWEHLTGTGASGKGTSDEGARASALCESLERFSGAFFGEEPRRTATADELGDGAVLPNEYMRFSERQYEQRDRWNEQAESFRTRVPEPFDPREPIDWSPAWSLTHGRERFLPTALCYYGAWVKGARFCIAESNGNAAGNTVDEAILHGLLELVERDHVALWWYNRVRAPAVELDSVADPWLGQLRDHLEAQGRDFWALDLTADLGIPVAACLVASPDGSGVGMGFGAHLDLSSAVVRAATELAQLGLGGSSGGLGHAEHMRHHLRDHAFARPDPQAAPRSCRDEHRFAGDVPAALEICRQAVERHGMELLVLDQTRPDIGLPVVKAVVPGMRHFWPRFAPGRLYDVPVTLGWLERPHREDELNPVPPTA